MYLLALHMQCTPTSNHSTMQYVITEPSSPSTVYTLFNCKCNSHAMVESDCHGNALLASNGNGYFVETLSNRARSSKKSTLYHTYFDSSSNQHRFVHHPLPAVKWTKFHLSSPIIGKISLNIHVVYSLAGLSSRANLGHNEAEVVELMWLVQW